MPPLPSVRFAISCAIACLLACASSRLDACTVQVFGPAGFVRATGDPTLETRTIAVADTSLVYRLRLVNGDAATGAPPATNADVYLNGVQIWSAASFTASTAELIAPVTVQASNTLAVRVRGAATSRVTISLLATDDRPVSVSFAIGQSMAIEGARDIPIVVRLDRPCLCSKTVQVAVVPQAPPGGASAGFDFMLVTAAVTFAPGQTTKDVVVRLLDDKFEESAERVVLELRTPSAGLTIGATARHTLTIADDEVQVRFAQGSSRIVEDDIVLSIPLSIVGTWTGNLEIRYQVLTNIVDPATAGQDFDIPVGRLLVPAGSVTAAIELRIREDQLREANENLVVNLVASTIAVRPVHVVQIVDDDARPTVAFRTPASSAIEASRAGRGTVLMSALSQQPVTVSYRVSGTAGAADHDLVDGSVVIEPGAIDIDIDFGIVDDELDELDETVRIVLVDPVNADLSPDLAEHVVTIIDDDGADAPTLSWALAGQRIEESVGHAVAIARLSRPSGRVVTATATFVGDAADAEAVVTNLRFEPGATEAEAKVRIIGDAIDEDDETVELRLGVADGAAVADPSAHAITIVDDDAAPTVAFAAPASQQPEADAIAAIDVLLDRASQRETRVALQHSGSATSGADFEPPVAIVVFAPGVTAARIGLRLRQDALDEEDETVVLRLIDPVGLRLGQDQHLLTIIDDDAEPLVAFAAASSRVGEAVRATTVTVILGSPAVADVVVPFTVGGSATASDAAIDSREVRIRAGATSATIAVAIIDDAIAEGDEEVVLTLQPPAGTRPGAPLTHVMTIIDDDRDPVVAFALDASTIAEDGGTASIEVLLEVPAAREATIAYRVGGSAGVDDAIIVDGVLRFAVGERRATIAVPVIADALAEGDETVILTLHTPVAARIGNPAAHVLTIRDDDGQPAVAFLADSSAVDESAGTAQVGLVLAPRSGQPTTVRFTVDGNAAFGADHRLADGEIVIPADTMTAAIVVPIVDDAIPEGIEVVVINLTTADGARIATPRQHALTIRDDDLIPVTPILEFVDDNRDGTFTAWFGYRNRATGSIGVAIGQLNRVEPGATNQGQAVIFAPGRTLGWPDCAFSVVFPENQIAWHLGTEVATGNRLSPRPPPPVEPPPTAQAPVARIDAPAAGVVLAGRALTVVVDAYDLDGAVRRIDLLDRGVILASAAHVDGQSRVFTVPALSTGEHIFTARATDDAGLIGVSAPVTVLARRPPEIALVRAGSGVVRAGDPIELEALASDADGSVVSVSFQIDGAALGEDIAAPFAWRVPSAAAGTSRFAAIATDDHGLTASAELEIRIAAPPSVAVTYPAQGQVVEPRGLAIPLTTVAADPDGRVARVLFLIDGAEIGSATASPYRFDWSPNGRIGAVSVAAVAIDDTGLITRSAVVSFQINAAPTVRIDAPLDRAVFQVGEPLIVRASASDPEGALVGLVLVKDGERIAETHTTTLAEPVSTSISGPQVFIAEAYDDQGGFTATAPIRIMVNGRPLIAFIAPAPNTLIHAGATATLAIEASDPGGAIERVELWLDGGFIAEDLVAPYQFEWTASASGFHQFEARAYDNDDGQSAATLAVMVNALPTVALTAPATAVLSVAAGQVQTLAASASDSDGTIVQVGFSVDGVAVGSDGTTPFEVPWTPSTLGMRTLSVTARDDRGGIATATRTILVQQAPNVAITTPASNSVHLLGRDIPVSVTATDADGTVGEVVILDGATEIARFTSRPYALTWSAPAAGRHRLTARAVDDRGAVGTSIPIDLTVNVAPQVFLERPLDGAVLAAGADLALAAVAADADGAIARVEFLRDDAVIASDATAPYQHVIAAAASGTYRLSARAIDANGEAAVSAIATVRVNAPPSVAIVAPPAGTVLASGREHQVTIEALDREGIHHVDLLIGADIVGRATAAPWTIGFVAEGTGARQLVARATDSDGADALSAPLPVIFNAAPTATLALAAGSGAYDPVTGLVLAATAADSDGSVAKVSFFDGDGLIGEDATAPYSLRWFGAEARPHVLTAVATDDRGATGVSNTLTITVNTLPRVAIVAPLDRQIFTAPAAVSVTAQATDADGTIVSVAFHRGEILLGTDMQAPYELALNDLGSGVYEVTATATDNSGGVTVSRAVAFSVTGGPVVALTAPAAGSLLRAARPVELTATASDADGTVAAVRFLVGDEIIAEDPTAPYAASWTPLASGPYVLSARAVDDVGAIAASLPVPVRVNVAPEVALAARIEGTSVDLTATATDVDGSVVGVRFFAGTTVLGSDAAAPYTYRWIDPPEGRHELVAEATDDRGAITLSPALVLTVNRRTAIPPTVGLIAPVTGDRFDRGTAIAMAATAADSDGTIARVEFYDGATKIGEDATAPYAFTWNGASAGLHGIAAVAIDNDGAATVSSQAIVTVNTAPSVTLIAPADGAVVAADTVIAISADAADVDGTVQGVEFLADDVVLGTSTARPFRLDGIRLASGNHRIRARATDDRGATSDSAVATIYANALPTVALTAPGAGVRERGGDVALSATAADSDGAIIEVAFLVNDRVHAVDGVPPYAATLVAPASGTYSIAVRARDDRGGSVVSPAVVVRIGERPTVTLTAPGDGAAATAGQPIPMAALVADRDGGAATVTFRVDGLPVADDASAPYSASWIATPGAHDIVAMVTDDTGFTATSATVRIVANAPPVVALTAPADGATVALGTPVELVATATDGEGSVSSVRFYAGAALLGTATASPWRYTWTGAAARTHDLTAVAVDDRGASATSAPVTLTVVDGNQPPTVALTAPTAASTLWENETVALAATAADADGAVAKVEWLLDDRWIVASDSEAPFAAGWARPTAGAHRLVARATDDRGRRTSSLPVDVRVRAASERPSIRITAPLPGAHVAEGAILEIVAEGSSPGATITGITVLVDGVVAGTSTTSPCRAEWNAAGHGLHPITARLTDSTGATLEATPIGVAVIARDLQIALVAPVDGATVIVGSPVILRAEVYNNVQPAEVEFYDGETRIGVDPSAPYSITWTPTTGGAHRLTARVIDYGQNQSSSPVTITAVVDSGRSPTVAFTVPAVENAVIGLGPVRGSVGTANPAASIVSWTLAYGLTSSNDEPETIASGSGAVSDAVLATFDTTLLSNDSYTLYLSGRDSRGRTAHASRRVRVEGAAKVGEFSFTVQDLAFSAGPVPLALLRTYSTIDRDQVGDFGYGWSASFTDLNVRLSEQRVMGTSAFGFEEVSVRSGAGGRDVTLTLPDGRRTTFTFEIVPSGMFRQSAVFKAAPGISARLAVSPASAGNLITLFPPAQPYWSGTEGWATSPWEYYDFPGFSLIMEDGTIYELTREDLGYHMIQLNNGVNFRHQIWGKVRLSRIKLPSGDAIEIDRDRIRRRDATGAIDRQIALVRDGAGRVTAAYDPNRQNAAGVSVDPAAVRYEYSPQGDLITVRRLADAASMPPRYDVTQYFYEDQRFAHYLTRIIGPDGNPLRMEYGSDGRLVAVVDADGQRTTVDHDLANNTETIFDRAGNPTTSVYDTRGNVVSVTDSLGNTISRGYDGRDNLAWEQNPLGHRTSYEYDAADNQTAIIDPLGNRTETTYNSRGHELTVKDARGHVTTNTYDGVGNLTLTRYPDGGTRSYVYDGQNRLDFETDSLGRRTDYAYDAQGNVASVVDALGRTTSFEHDANGNPTEVRATRTKSDGTTETLVTRMRYDAQDRFVSQTTADGATMSATYTPLGMLDVVTDALGRQTEYDYDARGNLDLVEYPDGTSVDMEHDADGRLTMQRDRASRITRHRYDASGRLTGSAFADGTSIRTVYDANSRVIETYDARGNRVVLAYDAADRRTSMAAGPGNVINFSHDPTGNVVSAKDGNSRTTTFAYDAMGRATRTTYPDGTSTETVYDLEGQITDEYDQMRQRTGFAYDALGRLIHVADALGQKTGYGYDEVGNQVGQTDALGRITRSEFDAVGRRTARVLPMGQREWWIYDVAGRLDRHGDFNGFTTTYTFDDADRLTRLAPDARRGEGPITFTYLPGGERDSMTDASGVTRYTYNQRGKLATKSTPFGSLAYRYDANGNTVSVRSSNGNGTEISYSYDDLNRLASVSDARIGTTSYRYDTVGNLVSSTAPNGIETGFTYDSLDRLTDVLCKKGSSVLAQYRYALSPTGRRTSVAELNRTVSYAYDATGRLQSEAVTGAIHSGTTTYTHDAVGNRLTRASTIPGISNQSFAYDANDRFNGHAHDGNGNTIDSGRGSDIYTFDNRLARRARSDGKIVEFVYDGDGNKVGEVVDGRRISFLVDTNSPTGYSQTFECISGTAVVASFVHGLSPVAQISDQGVMRVFTTDGLGSVRTISDERGAILESPVYDAFGMRLNAGEDPARGFAGYEWADSIDQYYLRARHYSPEFGRFWTRDPHPGDVEQPRTLHRYAYCGNDPVNEIDPSGLDFSLASVMSTVSQIGSLVARYSAPILRWESSFAQRLLSQMMGRKGKYSQATWHTYATGSLVTSFEYWITWIMSGGPAYKRRMGPHGFLKQNTRKGYQSNHILQNAAFNPRIPRDFGVAVELRGSSPSAFTEHGRFHGVLDAWWFVRGGRFAPPPIFQDYLEQTGLALLAAAPHQPTLAFACAVLGARQGIAYGIAPGSRIPRVPQNIGIK